MRYFIGNWKMFGVPKSINILNKINYFHSKDKNRQKYKVVITPPYTLIETYAKYFKIVDGGINGLNPINENGNTRLYLSGKYASELNILNGKW